MCKYEWYTLVSSSEQLQQGDLFINFPIFIPPDSSAVLTKEQDEISGKIKVLKYDIIVLTQSCDLLKFNDGSLVVLCAVFDYDEACKKNKNYSGEGWKELKNGRYLGVSLLNKCEIIGHEFEYKIVEYRIVFTCKYSFIKRFAASYGDRIRLLPPYRENVASSFGRLFMRVGLPIDLPDVKP